MFGVYDLRLINGVDVKTQKIVVWWDDLTIVHYL